MAMKFKTRRTKMDFEEVLETVSGLGSHGKKNLILLHSHAIYKVREKFNDTDLVAKKFGFLGFLQQRKMRMWLAVTFVNCSKKYMQGSSMEFSLPETSLLRLMHKLNLLPYHPRLLHFTIMEFWRMIPVTDCSSVKSSITNKWKTRSTW